MSRTIPLLLLTAVCLGAAAPALAGDSVKVGGTLDFRKTGFRIDDEEAGFAEVERPSDLDAVSGERRGGRAEADRRQQQKRDRSGHGRRSFVRVCVVMIPDLRRQV